MIRIVSALMAFGGMAVAALLVIVSVLLFCHRRQRFLSAVCIAGGLGFGAALAAGLFRQSCGPACRIPTPADLLPLGALLLLFTALLIGRIQQLKTATASPPDTN